MIEKEFKQILAISTSTTNPLQIDVVWSEVRNLYSSSNRYYHNLAHLENLLIHLTAVKYKIKKWPAVVFALVFHDVIYNADKQDNEEQSAEFAALRLSELGIVEKVITQCVEIIRATKHHIRTDDTDINIFIDADLAILGASPEDYKQYSKNIRKEYNLFPDTIYYKGRVQILEQLLARKQIYNSDYFFQKFESKARYNIINEIQELKGYNR